MKHSRLIMPIDTSAYLADTCHLTATEHGAYLLLLMHHRSHGSLPDDEARLARITRMNKKQWDRSRDVLAGFFDVDWDPRHDRHGGVK